MRASVKRGESVSRRPRRATRRAGTYGSLPTDGKFLAKRGLRRERKKISAMTVGFPCSPEALTFIACSSILKSLSSKCAIAVSGSRGSSFGRWSGRLTEAE